MNDGLAAQNVEVFAFLRLSIDLSVHLDDLMVYCVKHLNEILLNKLLKVVLGSTFSGIYVDLDKRTQALVSLGAKIDGFELLPLL